jgi:hypothetical protein
LQKYILKKLHPRVRALCCAGLCLRVDAASVNDDQLFGHGNGRQPRYTPADMHSLTLCNSTLRMLTANNTCCLSAASTAMAKKCQDKPDKGAGRDKAN